MGDETLSEEAMQLTTHATDSFTAADHDHFRSIEHLCVIRCIKEVEYARAVLMVIDAVVFALVPLCISYLPLRDEDSIALGVD